MAIQVRFFPSKRSGRNLSCSCLFPNFSNGGTPYDMPVVSEAGGPAKPDLDIYGFVSTSAVNCDVSLVHW